MQFCTRILDGIYGLTEDRVVELNASGTQNEIVEESRHVAGPSRIEFMDRPSM